MALRIKAIVLFVVGLVAAVAGLNFILNNVTLLNKLPETRVDQARREALQKPFYEREHRIERQPRLESGLSKEAQKNLQVGQDMRLAANEAVKTTLDDSKQASLTSEAYENLKADSAMRQDRNRQQESVILPDSTNDMERRAASQQLRSSQRSRQTDARPRGTAKAEPNDKYHVIARCDDMCELLSCLANEGFSEPDENISRKPDFQVSSVRVCEEMGL